jgi:hypothetical protein
MLEASNPDMTKKKKSTQISNSKPYQKYYFKIINKCGLLFE